MNSDIRLAVTFKDHRKRKKLAHRLGCEAVLALVDLWLSVAETKPSGALTGMDAEDIAIDAGWNGDAAEFVDTLCDIGFLDCDNGVYCLHDWADHNSYAAAAPQRSAKAKKAAAARWNKRLDDGPSKAGSNKEGTGSNAPSIKEQCEKSNEHGLSNSPSPSPSPSPAPAPIALVEDSTEFRLARLLFRCIQKNKPDFKKPNLQKWAKAVDLMIRIDGRIPKEIEQIIRWAQSDNVPDNNGFCWAHNVLSTGKLRKQYDLLVMKMDAANGNECVMSALPPELRGKHAQ